MIQITYTQMLIAISIAWVIIRTICCVKEKQFSWKREIQLLLVYVCIIVVVRFTFFPFGMVDGKIQPLLFDQERIFPLWINFVPFVYWFDYPQMEDALINLIGNTAMFIPLGIIWPVVFKKLNAPWKVIAAGVGDSLCIELLQLPFYDRATDIDDLIVNSLGFLIGYGIYLLLKKIRPYVHRT